MWIVHIFLMTETRMNIYLQNCHRLSTLIKAAAWLFLDTVRLLKIIHLSASWMYSITSPFELDSSILPPWMKFKNGYENIILPIKMILLSKFNNSNQDSWSGMSPATVQASDVSGKLNSYDKMELLVNTLRPPATMFTCWLYIWINIYNQEYAYFNAIIVYKLCAPMSSSSLL